MLEGEWPLHASGKTWWSRESYAMRQLLTVGAFYKTFLSEERSHSAGKRREERDSLATSL